MLWILKLTLYLLVPQEKGVNAEEIAFFTNLLSQASDAFVKTQLMSASYISQISSFVEEIAPLAQKGEVTHPKYNKGKLYRITFGSATRSSVSNSN